MKPINGDRVAEITSKCGKKLKVREVAGMLAQTIEQVGAKNPVVKQVVDKCGYDLCGALFGTIQTMFALNLLAKTHDSKEFAEIMKQIEIQENEA